MAPDSTHKTYVPSLKTDFNLRRIGNYFAAALTLPIYKLTVAGLARIFYKTNPLASTKRFAFTAHFLPHIGPALARDARTHHDDPYRIPADYLACKIGMWFCLRKSEYLPNNKHPSQPSFAKGLCLSDITFTGLDGRAIPHSALQSADAQRATLNICLSKTDQHVPGGPRTLCRAH